VSRGRIVLIGAAIGAAAAEALLFVGMGFFTLVSISNSGPLNGIVTGAFYTVASLLPTLGVGLLCGTAVSGIVMAIRTAR
jgi:hypothetical protein